MTIDYAPQHPTQCLTCRQPLSAGKLPHHAKVHAPYKVEDTQPPAYARTVYLAEWGYSDGQGHPSAVEAMAALYDFLTENLMRYDTITAVERAEVVFWSSGNGSWHASREQDWNYHTVANAVLETLWFAVDALPLEDFYAQEPPATNFVDASKKEN
jgi:hypothetical protein